MSASIAPRLCYVILAALILGCAASDPALAEAVAGDGASTYAHGNGALELFDEEAKANTPQWVNVWLMVMMVSFALGLIFVWKRMEARWAVGGFIVSIILGMAIAPALGLLPLSGLYALIYLVCWSPALYFLLKHRPFMGESSLYKYWSGLITVVILFSFIFDVRDAAIYLDHVAGIGFLS